MDKMVYECQIVMRKEGEKVSFFEETFEEMKNRFAILKSDMSTFPQKWATFCDVLEKNGNAPWQGRQMVAGYSFQSKEEAEQVARSIL